MSGREWKQSDALRECALYLVSRGYTIPEDASAEAISRNTQRVAKREQRRLRPLRQRQLRWD